VSARNSKYDQKGKTTDPALQGVANVVASMLNLSEGVVDVFKGDGYFEFEEAVSEHYSKKLREYLQECMEDDPSDRPTFPEVLQEIREHRLSHQAGLRDEPAESYAWEDHLLLETITDIVCGQAHLVQNSDYVLTSF
jgi:hypothetical protein